MSNKAVNNFETKCKKFFDAANGGEPLTPGALCRVIRKACPSFKGEDSEIAAMFFDVDKDHDSLISWEEFTKAMFAKDPKEITRAELEETFKDVDKDGSGKLSRAEIGDLIKSLEIKVSDEGLTSLMEESDPNGDGVDIQEFLAAFKDILS
ncbi:calmodulin-like [Plakobranchus ocellatus]|uniref:Calmodulin-like n=1 Tax=Plakobranchus ocellatus TaxID=259542 RepID=A0AAV4DWH1_9GAST|nr:calmodulin-like [Plakobranchus ocellatus]